jgi:hypothetical protein
MHWSDIPWNPPARTLRQFAGLFLVIVGAMGCWQAVGHDRLVAGVVLMGLAVVVGAVGLVRPVAVRWVYVGLMIVVFPVGWVVSRVILAFLFYGLFTPLALLFRVIGRDALRLRKPGEVSSYWRPKVMSTDAASYFRQF